MEGKVGIEIPPVIDSLGDGNEIFCQDLLASFFPPVGGCFLFINFPLGYACLVHSLPRTTGLG